MQDLGSTVTAPQCAGKSGTLHSTLTRPLASAPSVPDRTLTRPRLGAAAPTAPPATRGAILLPETLEGRGCHHSLLDANTAALAPLGPLLAQPDCLPRPTRPATPPHRTCRAWRGRPRRLRPVSPAHAWTPRWNFHRSARLVPARHALCRSDLALTRRRLPRHYSTCVFP